MNKLPNVTWEGCPGCRGKMMKLYRPASKHTLYHCFGCGGVVEVNEQGETVGVREVPNDYTSNEHGGTR